MNSNPVKESTVALQNFQYDIIMREYSRRQSQVQHDLEERRKEAFIRVPRLLEIDQEVAALSARKARSLLLGESDTVERSQKRRGPLWLRNAVHFFAATDFLMIIWNLIISVHSVRILGYVDGQKCSCFKKSVGRITVHTVKS